MGFLTSFLKNNYRAIFGLFVVIVVIYAFSIVLSSSVSSPDDDLARRLRIMFSSRLHSG